MIVLATKTIRIFWTLGVLVVLIVCSGSHLCYECQCEAESAEIEVLVIDRHEQRKLAKVLDTIETIRCFGTYQSIRRMPNQPAFFVGERGKFNGRGTYLLI